MRDQTLLLDDYGMFLLNRLSDAWDEVYDSFIQMKEHSSAQQRHIQVSQEYQAVMNDFVQHLVLLMSSPDLVPRRLEPPHRLLTGSMVAAILDAVTGDTVEKIFAYSVIRDEVMIVLDELAIEQGKPKKWET